MLKIHSHVDMSRPNLVPFGNSLGITPIGLIGCGQHPGRDPDLTNDRFAEASLGIDDNALSDVPEHRKVCNVIVLNLREKWLDNFIDIKLICQGLNHRTAIIAAHTYSQDFPVVVVHLSSAERMAQAAFKRHLLMNFANMLERHGGIRLPKPPNDIHFHQVQETDGAIALHGRVVALEDWAIRLVSFELAKPTTNPTRA